MSEDKVVWQTCRLDSANSCDHKMCRRSKNGEEKVKVGFLPPALEAPKGSGKKSILRRLRTQLESPTISDAGRLTIERVIKALEKSEEEKLFE